MALHSYTPLNWQDAPGHKTTPTSAANFNHMEQGIADAYSDIAALNDAKVEKTDVADVEAGTTASRAYSAGELVYVSGTLYKVTTDIANGATFTVGTNISATTIGTQITSGKVLATAGSGTWGQHIAVIKPVFDALSNDEKMRCVIERNTNIYHVSQTTGCFAFVQVTTEMSVAAINLNTSKAYSGVVRASGQTTSFADVTGSTDTSTWSLILI